MDSRLSASQFISHPPKTPTIREQRVKDARVISLCHQHGFLLFTLDKSMKEAHSTELCRTDIGVIAGASNDKYLPSVWVQAFIKAKPRILRDFKKHERPYFSILQRTGSVSTEVVRQKTRLR
jgi:hypothetical protein